MAAELAAMGVEVWPISKCMAQVIEVGNAPTGCSVTTVGSWSANADDCYSKQMDDGNSYVISVPSGSPSDSVRFTPDLPVEGDYDVYAIWKVDPSNATDVRVSVRHNTGTANVTVDQTQALDDWYYLGRYSCSAGSFSYVTISDSQCATPGDTVRADAVKYVYNGPPTASPVTSWAVY